MLKYLAPALGSLLLLSACGGGGGYSTPPPPPPPPVSGPNVATLTVEPGPAQDVNVPFISITVCAPGTTNCQTIDNIEVDTASWGLRIIASVLNPSLLSALPQQMVAGTTIPVVECAQFANSFSWGPVMAADVTISSEKASNIPVHIIGNPTITQAPPPDCSSIGMEQNTVALFGANGLIGVGVFQQDCGGACAGGVVAGTYYQCPTNGAACTGITELTNLQVSNPVAFFTGDNNGVIVELPSAMTGAASATGALVFGIGTQSNNALGNATILATDPGTGEVSVTFGTTQLPGVLDTGSNGYFFADSALTACTQGGLTNFYCTPANISTTITTHANTQLAANFSVGDAFSMFTAYPAPPAAVFPQLAGPLPATPNQVFDYGLPYFYGRNVYVAIENTSAGGTPGPYLAF